MSRSMEQMFFIVLLVSTLVQSSFAANVGNAAQGSGQKSRSWLSRLWKPAAGLGAAGFAYYAQEEEKFNQEQATIHGEKIRKYEELGDHMAQPWWLSIDTSEVPVLQKGEVWEGVKNYED